MGVQAAKERAHFTVGPFFMQPRDLDISSREKPVDFSS
jgi:hypothetical protein